ALGRRMTWLRLLLNIVDCFMTSPLDIPCVPNNGGTLILSSDMSTMVSSQSPIVATEPAPQKTSQLKIPNHRGCAVHEPIQGKLSWSIGLRLLTQGVVT